MKKQLLRLAPSLLTCIAGICTPCLAATDEYWVDAVNGDDFNSGASSNEAWRTISHALTRVPTPAAGDANQIHIAVGLYDAALGENFPLRLRPGLQLIGDSQGSVIDGGGANVAIVLLDAGPSGVAAEFDSFTLLQRLILQHAARGVDLRCDGYAISPRIYDLQVRDMSNAGLRLEARGARAFPQISNVVLEQNAVGLRALILDGASDSGFDLGSSLVSNNLSAGIDCETSGVALAVNSRFLIGGSFIVGNHGDGMRVRASELGTFVLLAHDCVSAQNAGNGVAVFHGSPHAVPSLAGLEHLTIADNQSGGVVAHRVSAQLRECIVQGNADDLSYAPSGPPMQVSYCDIGDGDFNGTAGNIAQDASFANAALGDFTLRPDSPCIDAGDPSSPRNYNCSRAEIGAFVFLVDNSSTYCSAKSNSCGTLPTISALGIPSASALAGFVVSVSNSRAGKSGLLLYSLSGPAATPFGGGWICLRAPILRAIPVVDISGTPGSCDGTLALDMNAFARGALGGTPAEGLSVPGTAVHCQFWARDGASNPLLSNALAYFVCD